MNKQVLSPFDCDMCAMIEDITKQEIEVTASDTSIRLSWAQNGSDGNDTPEAFDVPKDVEAMAASFADMFPGSEIQIQRVDLKKNPRNKCRAKNKRKGGRRNEK